MKKLIYLIPIVALVLGSCNSNASQETVPQPQKIANYLYEVTIDDYSDTIPNGLISQVGAEFNCSAVRNGNFYGRNLDFFISEMSEFVVHIPAKEGRHASIGVSRIENATDSIIDAGGVTAEQYAKLPWGTFDGINDQGLFCNMNVVPASDQGAPHTGTNPGMPDVQSAFLVRALLDNCGSVDEAVEYINSHNIIGMDKGGFDLHFMIGDPNKNVVLEFIDNKAVIKDQNIMTNFFVNRDELTPHADGVERYEILKANYDEGGKSMEGMRNLMKQVRFSQAYDPDMKPFWKSEFLGGDVTINTKLEDVLARPNVKEQIANFKHFKETGEYTPEMKLWFTTHTSVYDIKNRTLSVTVREDYDNHYEFQLK